MNGRAYPVATNQNLTTSQGQAPISSLGKTAIVVTLIIPGNSTIPIVSRGDRFYLIYSSAQIEIRPRTGTSVGVFNPYVQGTGQKFSLENSFNALDVQNSNASAVFIQLFVGFEDYIDNRLIIAAAPNNPQALVGVYDSALDTPAASVSVTDKSGTTVTDADGDTVYAISRTAALVFNPSAVNIEVYDAAGTRRLGIAYPTTSLRLDNAGALVVKNAGGGNVDGVISEIYSAVAI